MVQRLRTLFFAGFLCLLPSLGLAEDFVIGKRTFSVAIPSSWTAKTGVFELPLVVLAPLQKDKSRPVVSFTGPSKGTSSADLDPKLVSALEKKLKQSRGEWLKKRQATLIDFTPFELKTIPEGKRLSWGLRYEEKGKVKTESNYYLTCKGQFVMAKILVPSPHDGFLPEAQSMVEGLTCR